MYKKLDTLIEERGKTLGFQMIEIVKDRYRNVHVLGKRKSDGLYAVWTSYYTGEDRTSYVGFYNGMYDISEVEGKKEIERRKIK